MRRGVARAYEAQPNATNRAAAGLFPSETPATRVAASRAHRVRCPFARPIERFAHEAYPFTNISVRPLRALTYALTVAVAAARRSCLIQPLDLLGEFP